MRNMRLAVPSAPGGVAAGVAAAGAAAGASEGVGDDADAGAGDDTGAADTGAREDCGNADASAGADAGATPVLVCAPGVGAASGACTETGVAPAVIANSQSGSGSVSGAVIDSCG